MPHQCTDCGRAFADGSKEMLSGCPDCGGNKFQFLPERAVDGNAGGAGGAASAATAPKKTPEEAPATATDAPETGGGGRSRSGTNGRSKSGSDDQASAVNRAAATVREWVSVRDDSNDDDHPEETPSKPSSEIDRPASEDSAQASARRDVVSKSELPDEPARGKTVSDTDTSSESSAVSETGAVSDTGTISDTGPVSNTEAVSDSGTVSQSGAVPDTDAVPDNGSEAPETHDDENVVDAPKDENPGLKELREELNSQFESIRIVNPGHYELNLMELYEREEYIISLQEDGKYVIEVPDAWEQTER